MHVDVSQKWSRGLLMAPVVRSWEKSVDMKEARQAISKIDERLKVVIHLIYVPSSMIKVNVRQDKFAIWF